MCTNTGRQNETCHSPCEFSVPWRLGAICLCLNRPHWQASLMFYKSLIDIIFEIEIAPLLRDHHCDPSAPCVLLRKAMQACVSYLSVCKLWNTLMSATLKQRRFACLKAPTHIFPSINSTDVALHWHLDARYRAYSVIEREYG